MKRATTKEVAVPAAATLKLAKGEVYAGILLKDDGTPSHHLVLLAAKSKPLTWDEAREWATKQGGELPSRREQSLLMANAKQHLEGRWHWSSEQHESYGDYAWLQTFSYGTQHGDDKGSKLLARAVRRVPV